MEGLASVIEYISNFGFPAVFCIVMIWQNWKQNELHKSELMELRTALENNTQALNDLKMLLYAKEGINYAARS